MTHGPSGRSDRGGPPSLAAGHGRVTGDVHAVVKLAHLVTHGAAAHPIAEKLPNGDHALLAPGAPPKDVVRHASS